MKIYNSHPVTGEYLGDSLADSDPLDEGRWLIPANAYTDAPPVTGKNKVAVRDGGAWKVVDDYRGTVYYIGSQDPYVIEDLGLTVPVDATDTPPPPTSVELTALALGRRDGLLGVAAIRIAPLQDAFDLGLATDADTESLHAWKQYRIAVNRIDQQPGFPASIDWPAPPA
ncbi:MULTISPECIES: tail fiber assembly protein [Pseudomonas]|uniref:Tail fiber assembly protein n=1 Tax=Pseudomonas gingeri TaxID=117681 RepID=A0A7Y7WNV3_9PSED|nr:MULTISPECIES: tail fiber assembly protein [Pseudomonas]MPQ67120.1 hypothetical protein [Pseudomonas sp. MWU12-2323]NWB85010.1 tail fiber assembly protein [Pseudomonas gingeri]